MIGLFVVYSLPKWEEYAKEADTRAGIGIAQ